MNALRLAAAVLLVLPCLPAVAGENASEQLSALIEEDWRYRLDEDPLNSRQSVSVVTILQQDVTTGPVALHHVDSRRHLRRRRG